MTSRKLRFVAVLVGLFPARWKREYGAEFADVLMSRPLDLPAVLDIVWNALCQQVRCGEPWLVAGVSGLALHIAVLASNIAFPSPYAADSFRGGTLARVVACLLPFAIGYWTVLRDPIQGHGGRAAIKSSLLTTWPFCVVAILYGMGVLKIIVLGPGDATSTFYEHGFAYTIYDHARRPIHWQPLFLLPFVELPFPGVLGWLGGLAARAQAGFRRRPV